MPGDPAVRTEVLAQLRPLGDEERKAFEDLVRQLDANDFPAREAASRKLGEGYGRYREPIEKLLKDGKLAPEARNRLQSVVDAKGREVRRVAAAVAALGLLDDVDGLIGLLDEAKGPDAAAVVERLKKLTGQDLPDAAAWRKWRAAQAPAAGGSAPAK
jgi:hypothetical protein